MDIKEFREEILTWIDAMPNKKDCYIEELRDKIATKVIPIEPQVIPKIAGKWMLRQVGVMYEKCWYYEIEEELNKALTEFLDIDYSGYNYEKYYIEKR